MTTVKIPSGTATPERQTQRMWPQPSLQQGISFPLTDRQLEHHVYPGCDKKGKEKKDWGEGWASLLGRMWVLALECSMTVTEWSGLELSVNTTAVESGDIAHSLHLLTHGAHVSEWPGPPSREAVETRKSKGTESQAWQGPQNSSQSRFFILSRVHDCTMLFTFIP